MISRCANSLVCDSEKLCNAKASWLFRFALPNLSEIEDESPYVQALEKSYTRDIKKKLLTQPVCPLLLKAVNGWVSMHG